VSVLQAAPYLTHLKLKSVNSVSFEAIARLCPNLQVLSVFGTNIGAANLVLISERCPNISNLKLNSFWCSEKDSVYEAVFQNLRLHTLIFNHGFASSKAISYIGKYMYNTLTTLYICVTNQCDVSVYWDVLQQCRRLHTLSMDSLLLVELGTYRNRHKPELGTFEHIQSLHLQAIGASTHCRALQFTHEMFPNMHTLHVHSGADEVMNSIIRTVESCAQLRALYVQKMKDTTKRALQKINPRLLIYTI